MNKRKEKKTRLQFDLTETELKLLDEVMYRLGATSRAETFRRSIRLMDSAIKGKLQNVAVL